MFAAATTANADEGMWTLYDLPQAVYNQMKGYGFELPYSQLYESSDAIKNCVINFGGFCSGVVVSPSGLVFTNHHCGFGAINKLSSVEHDYMLNGFYAKETEAELPCEDLHVSFMISQQDVTERLEQMGINSMMPKQQAVFLDSVENAWLKEARKDDPNMRIELKAFYEGNKYYVSAYHDFKDIRLVFTAPKSMGKFGGETDNWMWPRQTCDFSVFRIYADPKTNGPAEYSKGNVPYKPAKWAKVSTNGYKEGDFSMTIGYPGSTNRYLSSYGIRERRDAANAPRAEVRGVKQEIMKRHMDGSDAVRLKYETAYAKSSNYWKNSIGMNKCIDSIGLIKQKADYEAKIKAYQDSTGYLKGKLDFDLMERLYNKRLEVYKAFTYFVETFWGTSELATRARMVHNGMEVKGPAGKPKKQYVVFEDNSDKWDAPTDKEVLAMLINFYGKHVDKKYLPDFYKTLRENFGGNVKKYVQFVWDNSILMKSGKKIYINKKDFKNDCGVQMGLDILSVMADMREQIAAVSDTIKLQERYLCAAKLRMEMDMPHYSDANMTMRLSYGQVGGYNIGGINSGYYTTAKSLVNKMKQADQLPDYKAEPVMMQLFDTDNFGIYSDKQTEEMQLCFLTNNDITGGNSGSPLFNARGELLGLAFDGNWDSLSSDIFFDSKLARCINVDVRYMLYIMDKWGNADRLMKELGVY